MTVVLSGMSNQEQLEEPELEYDDGLVYVYFNTKGKIGGSSSIENMLRYIQDSDPKNAVDEATSEINQYVKTVKTDPRQREDYMTWGYYIDQEKAESKAEEKAENECKLIEKVIKKLIKGKSIPVIADELEEEETYISAICSAAEKYAPDYDAKKIYQDLTEPVTV